MKIALITPWPPQRSGIADYAFRLAQGLLAQGVELCVVTAEIAPAPLTGCAIHVSVGQYDTQIPADALPVFQLGNNLAFHAFQPALLTRLGGVVHLHDPVLHHFHVDRTLAAGVGGYWEDLSYWYGAAVANTCRKMIELGAPPWANAAVTAIPLFEPYLQFADAVVVHSSSALRTINERMPALRGFCLPQCYPMPNTTPAPQRHRGPQRGPESNALLGVVCASVVNDFRNSRAPASRPLRIGVFGWIEPHKRVDQILAAISILHRRGIAITLDICGSVGATMGTLPEQIDAMQLGGVVRLRGHLEHAQFVSEIASVDLCVNLRDPTMGETSAIVVQALQSGTPVIVSDVGWYAELPECVLKVPTGPGAVHALSAHLLRLHDNRQELLALAEATRHYAKAELDFGATTARYAAIMAELASTRAQTREIERVLYHDVARALADLDLSDSGHEAAFSAQILRALAPCL